MNRYQIVIVTEGEFKDDLAAKREAIEALNWLNESGNGSGGFFSTVRLAEVDLE